MKKELEISCSVPSLLGPSTLPLLALPMEGWVAVVKAMGYHGLEWRPLRIGLAETQVTTGRLSNKARASISSAEQSYRGERTWQETCQHPQKRVAQVSYWVFPHRTESLPELARLQALVGKIPVTVYPSQDVQEDVLQQGIDNKLIQPAPDVAKKWKISSFTGLIEEYQKRGYSINLDLAHYFRLRSLFPLPDTKEAIRLMLSLIKEVQVSAGRTDISPDNQDTKLAYQDLLKGTAKSATIQMLVQILEMGYRGLIVTEIPSFAIEGSNPVKLFRTHQLITRNLINY